MSGGVGIIKFGFGSGKQTIPPDSVTSVFGRTGAVVAENNDYNASQIENTPSGNISSNNVQGALNELDSEKQPINDILTAISNLTNSGFIVFKAPNQVFNRIIEGATGRLSVSNGDGANANPIIDLQSIITAGTFNSQNSIPIITYDEYGRITDIQSNLIDITSGQVSDFTEAVQDVVGNTLADSIDIDFIYNDITNTLEAFLTTTGVVAGSYGTSNKVPVISVDNKGRVESVSETLISITSSQISDFNSSVRSLVNSPNVIRVATANGDFTTIADAVNSISGSSASNRYIISVGAGVFGVDNIDLTTKPYVSIKGEAIQTTVLESSGTNDMLLLGVFNEVSFLTLRNAPTNKYAISCVDSGDFSQTHKVSFIDCWGGIQVKSTTVSTYHYAEYVDFNGAFQYAIRVESTSTPIAFMNAENYYVLPTSGTPFGTYVTGTFAQCFILAGGAKNTSPTGVATYVENGGYLEAQSFYTDGWGTGLSIPNVGVTPTAQFTGCVMDDNTVDISVQHVTGAGNYQGTMDNPSISIVSTSPFGVSYLESILGNKSMVYYDSYNIAGIAGTVPTTTAATNVLVSSVTGITSLSFSGTADNSGAFTFRVPNDYLRNGRFKISFSCQATSANNFYLSPIISCKNLGDNITTQTETLTPQVITAGTVALRQESGWFTPTTNIVKDMLIVFRLNRLATNVLDTYTSAIYVNGVFFEYESSR